MAVVGRQVIEFSRKVLLQKEALLSGMEKLNLEDVYGRTCGTVGSTIGSHVRHSLDHYARLVDGLAEAKGKGVPVIEYDNRIRGSPVETDLGAGFEAIMDCSMKLGQLDPEWLQQPVNVEFFLDGSGNCKQCFPSNGLREMWFVAHHSIHHQAMIKIIANSCKEANLLQKAIPKNFGMAPATIIFHDAEEHNTAQ